MTKSQTKTQPQNSEINENFSRQTGVWQELAILHCKSSGFRCCNNTNELYFQPEPQIKSKLFPLPGLIRGTAQTAKSVLAKARVGKVDVMIQLGSTK